MNLLRWHFLVLVVLSVVGFAAAQTSYPMITHTTPVAVQRGKTTEVTVFFKEVPAALFAGEGLTPPVPNLLSIRIQPEEGMSFAFQAKPPGLHLANQTVAMDFSYREWFEGNAEAYERLIHDAMVGDPTLFIRQDAVERAWSWSSRSSSIPGRCTPTPPAPPASGRSTRPAPGARRRPGSSPLAPGW